MWLNQLSVHPLMLLNIDFNLPYNTYEASTVLVLQSRKDNDTVYMVTVLMTVCFHLLYLIYHRRSLIKKYVRSL